ncbi:MAG: tRNA (adenosine(37)-N6)-dimethylallyltransferase MiaA [Dehalococcoidales bacterium]|nr:tRNA (adenosine(37)-N6)-dimethylallyltransferase MiaA [Dehalococcoidales bacterium]
MNNELVAIVGPTGTGKSKLAIKLAKLIGAEIISCDSRQVYRYMDIGTAKLPAEERLLVPHHLIDIVNPNEDLSLAQYQQLAYQTSEVIRKKNKIPMLVGGTGQYFQAVIEGWQIPRVEPDIAYRKSLEKRSEAGETLELYRELTKIDPDGAKKIDPHNIRRIIRALEVYRSQGIPFSQLKRKSAPPYRTLIIGLHLERQELYRRVDLRVDDMINQGLVREVQKLIEMGYDTTLPAMSGIGYRQISQFLGGQLSLPEAIQQIKYETHRYIRQQYLWFRLKDERINWFNIAGDNEEDCAKLVRNFLEENPVG